jgi:NAD(P)-dependent dehydrogenase (short-subunit alcohol dehydrogenase family)
MSQPRVRTPFGPLTTAEEVIAGIDLTGQTAIVTGGASGIGLETSRALASANADVTVAVRNLAAGEQAVEDIIATTGNPNVRAALLDLADLDSIDAFVADWRAPLHILVANAGVMGLPLTRTPQGWELQFATNHLGHFALTTGLYDYLAAAGRDRGARVVAVTSAAHLLTDVVWDDIHFTDRDYNGTWGYAQSKTANVLFAVELNRRGSVDGIRANAVMPGRIATRLWQATGQDAVALSAASTETEDPAEIWKSPSQGASTSVLLAASPLVEGIGGRYFEDGNEAAPHVPGVFLGVAPYALDPESAARLWQVSIDTLAAR